MSKNPIKNVLTIGDGIAAWCLHEELLKQEGIKITNISSDEFFPACSTRTTSINCLRGTTEGVSPLGDLIFSSYKLFEEFYYKENPDGIWKGIEYQIWKDEGKWEKRYPEFLQVEHDEFLSSKLDTQKYYHPNEAFFIDPIKLKHWYKQRHQAVDFKKALVKSIDNEGSVKTSIGDFQFDKIVLTTSYATSNLGYGLNDDFDYYLDHCKPVAGTYLEIDIDKINIQHQESFNLAIGSHHFIYRKEQGKIQIGSTTDNRCQNHLPNTQGIKKIYDSIKNELMFEIPGFEKFTQFTGIRQKGHKRLPYWGKLSPNIYGITGLYKNAFTFAYQSAQDLSQKI